MHSAGGFYLIGDQDGPCLTDALMGGAFSAVWNEDGDMFVLFLSKDLKRIHRPNQPECMVLTVGGDVWPGESSLFGGMFLESADTVLMVAGLELRRHNVIANTHTTLVGQYTGIPEERGWMEGYGCRAKIGRPSMVLAHHADTHGGDHSVYLVDRGTYGFAPSIWRISLPCPSKEYYWAGDGMCTKTIPHEVCSECQEDGRYCLSGELTEVSCFPLPPPPSKRPMLTKYDL